MADIFIFDTNSFIEPYKKFYAFDLAPNYWAQFETRFSKNECILLDAVYDEIAKNKDGLYQWLIRQKKTKIKRDRFLDQYTQIINYIHDCNYYNPKALNVWSNYDHADPWLIAAGMVLDGTIVTFEKASGNKLSAASKVGKIKIADVANEFNVSYMNIYEYMRVNNIML